jgi:hypothetical protein
MALNKTLALLLITPLLLTCATNKTPPEEENPIPAFHKENAQKELAGHLPREIGRCLSSLGVLKGINIIADPPIEDDVLEHFFFDCIQRDGNDENIKMKAQQMLALYSQSMENLNSCYFQAGILHERLKFNLVQTTTNALSDKEINNQVNEFLGFCSSRLNKEE